MKRTQIYLLESQKEELERLALQKGKAMAEVIREAVDKYIAENKLSKQSRIIESSGLWKDRDDINADEYLHGLREETQSRLEDKNE